MPSPVTIYHNPRCSNSRGALALIEAAGIQPVVIDYLGTPPSTDELKRLITEMGIRVRELIREKEAIYTELGLDKPTLSDDELIAAMVANPILINRPIVVTSKGVRLCRPPEIVNQIL